MAGRSRSGFANDTRAYRCPIYCFYTPFAPSVYSLTYSGNTNRSRYVAIGNLVPNVGNYPSFTRR